MTARTCALISMVLFNNKWRKKAWKMKYRHETATPLPSGVQQRIKKKDMATGWFFDSLGAVTGVPFSALTMFVGWQERHKNTQVSYPQRFWAGISAEKPSRTNKHEKNRLSKLSKDVITENVICYLHCAAFGTVPGFTWISSGPQNIRFDLIITQVIYRFQHNSLFPANL